MARRKKVYKQTGKSKTAYDKRRTAKKPGWRTSRSNRRYFENRRNRSDVNPRLRL